MTETADEQIKPVENKPKRNGASEARKGTLKKLMNRATTDEGGKGGTLRRRRMRFLIDHRMCDPGGFDEDFYLVIESPSTEIELAALKKCGDSPLGLVFEMARLCVISVDGEPVRDSDLTRDAVWEALGNLGRACVVRKWQELSGGAETGGAALKKMEDSTELLI